MRRRARGAKLIADINITPLTDVALGVLLIFMVAAPVIYQSSIQVRLPKTVTAQKPPRTVTVTVNAAGEVAFEETLSEASGPENEFWDCFRWCVGASLTHDVYVVLRAVCGRLCHPWPNAWCEVCMIGLGILEVGMISGCTYTCVHD